MGFLRDTKKGWDEASVEAATVPKPPLDELAARPLPQLAADLFAACFAPGTKAWWNGASQSDATADFYEHVMGMPLVNAFTDPNVPSTGDPYPFLHFFHRMQDGSIVACAPISSATGSRSRRVRGPATAPAGRARASISAIPTGICSSSSLTPRKWPKP